MKNKKAFDIKKLEKIAVADNDAYTLWTVSELAQGEWLNSINIGEVSKKIKHLNKKSVEATFSKDQLRTSLRPYMDSANDETLRQLIG